MVIRIVRNWKPFLYIKGEVTAVRGIDVCGGNALCSFQQCMVSGARTAADIKHRAAKRTPCEFAIFLLPSYGIRCVHYFLVVQKSSECANDIRTAGSGIQLNFFERIGLISSTINSFSSKVLNSRHQK